MRAIQPSNGRVAIITGVTGQDGSYLSEYLLSKGYYVVGVIRRSSVDTTLRISHLHNNHNFELVEGDLTDYCSIERIIAEYHPDEIYNLAAQSHVATSFKQPVATWRINAEGPINVLEAVRRTSPYSRVYQASTSEMFGSNYTQERGEKFQNEHTPFSPNSPYAIAKVAAHHAVRVYRDSYGLFACCGILFNHESPRRGEKFVTRKITDYIGQLVRQLDCSSFCDIKKLQLGNLDATRDWGHAKDYVRGMYLMMQQDEPRDYVLATGIAHPVSYFLKCAFNCVGIEDWSKYVEVNAKFFRPCEVPYLKGDASFAQEKLGWKPEISFEELVEEMVK